MIDVNWDLAPEGAETLRQVKKFGYLRWFNKEGQAYFGIEWDFPVMEYETIATRPTQTKTVADAVEWANGEWVGDSRFIVYQEELGKFAFVVSEKPYMNGWGLVCTREEFEAYVKEQESSQQSCSEGEKWTHGIPPSGIYCRVLHKGEVVNCYLIGRDDMGAFVYRIDGDYYATASETNFRPIKPTISTKEYDMLAKYASHLNVNPSEFDQYISETYEVIDD